MPGLCVFFCFFFLISVVGEESGGHLRRKAARRLDIYRQIQD